MNREHFIPVLAAFLAIVLLACGPTATVVPTQPPPITQVVVVTATPGPLTTALPTEAPLEPTTAAGCTLGGRWVADVTVPDNTEFPPGSSFTKTWRVSNSGTCPWEVGTQLVFVSGEAMGGPPSVSVPATAAGAQTDISVNFTAPTAPGTYRGNWQLQAPDGTRYGSVIWVQIVVPGPTPSPSAGCTASIDFRADRTTIAAGEHTTLRWDVECVQGVYLDGAPVTGHETRDVAPATTTTYTLHVVKNDGSAEDRQVTITVESAAGPPDLYPSDINMSTWTPRVNEEVQVEITLRNDGDSPVPDFTVRLIAQNPGNACPGGAGTVLFDAHASLEAHGSMVFRQAFRFSRAGTYQLCAILDHLNRVAESNEDNNAIKSDRDVVVSP